MNEINAKKIDYYQLREFISREFGLYFEAEKFTFLENRVIPIFLSHNCTDLNHFIKFAQSDQNFKNELLDSLTTNETWFFRHPKHFEILKEVLLPSLIKETEKQQRREITIWSAGSSIGAEAYSIAIVVAEFFKEKPGYTVKIFGSDISPRAVEKAKKGTYTASEIRLIPQRLLLSYFQPTSNGNYQVKHELSKNVTFEVRNLLSLKWIECSFDIIFCRNTMIYFREDTKRTLTERFFAALRPGGIFMPGSTEVLHWGEGNHFIREFAMSEYYYRKCVRDCDSYQYLFATPHDLLKAINILIEENIEFTISPVNTSSITAAKRTLYISKDFGEATERIFENAGIKTALRKRIECKTRG
ncbi:MAG: protein-glutamate O-methyltransferase CheR [Candidatus Riflebacteria bacterium]|nr:protein-glutamate O-methyltransferase CheR [Candidatus Riflebacteria bacterium]